VVVRLWAVLPHHQLTLWRLGLVAVRSVTVVLQQLRQSSWRPSCAMRVKQATWQR
jgi:hypothetical protein